MKRRSPSAQNTEPSGSGRVALALLGVAVLVAALGMLLPSARPWPWPAFRAVLWLLFMVLFYATTSLFLARFLLPAVTSSAHWLEAVLLLLSHPVDIIFPSNTLESAPEELPSSMKRKGAAILPPHLALALAQNNTFTRMVGPGYVRLLGAEQIGDVLDLREHYQRTPVDAMTKDGIPVATSVAVRFCVRRPENAVTDVAGALPYPYLPGPLFHLTKADSVGEDGEKISWQERVGALAGTLLVEEIYRYTLDELLAMPGQTMPAISGRLMPRLGEELDNALECTAESRPLELLAVDVGKIEPSEAELAERLENWGVLPALPDDEQVEVVDEQPVDSPQAQAQLALIAEVVESVRTVHQATGAPLSRVVLQSALDLMQESTSAGEAQPELAVALAHLHQLLGEQEAGS